MKKLFLLFAFILMAKFSFSQDTWQINQYNIPYTVYSDTIMEDTVSVYVNYLFDEKIDLAIQAWATTAISGDTIAGKVNVALSEVFDANAFETDYSLDSLYSSNTVSRKDTSCYSEYMKFTIETTDTSYYNIVVKALKPIE